MYWQVYLHKTVLSAEFLLAKILERAREILLSGSKLFVVPSLKILLSQKITSDNISQIEFLKFFSKVDDYDVFTCVKIWCDSSDKIISSLSKMLIERKLPKVKISGQKFSFEDVENCKSIHQKSLMVRSLNYIDSMKMTFFSVDHEILVFVKMYLHVHMTQQKR